MKRSALILAAAIVAAACQEIATSPQTEADVSAAAARFSNPPPPPIDTGASGSIAATSIVVEQSASRSSGLPAAPGFERFSGTPQSLQDAGFFTIPVTYMFDPNGNSGYLHFHSDPDNDVEADASGMVKFRHGIFSGMGFVTIETNQGTLVIDLSSIDTNASFFEGCDQSQPPVIDIAQRPDSLCFEVNFDDVTLDGVPVPGGVTLFPDCYPSEENQFCDVPNF